MKVPKSPSKIGARAAATRYGVQANHECMPSGELRFRLMSDDGNGYIQTRAVGSQWQNSHFHRHTAETYIVERGWIVLAIEMGPASADFWRFDPGLALTTPIGKAHNVYLPTGAIIHTVKHGGKDGARDWNAAPQLDDLIGKLGEGALAAAKPAYPGLLL
jgi:mannose-6-phosphate isomerase-like protein (cupin superfamily)